MKTAVEWLEEKTDIEWIAREEWWDIIELAKEMEKDQIKTAYLNGHAFGIDIDNGLSPSNYYNETFKQEEQ